MQIEDHKSKKDLLDCQLEVTVNSSYEKDKGAN